MTNCKCGCEMVLIDYERSEYLDTEYYECENCEQKATITWNLK